MSDYQPLGQTMKRDVGIPTGQGHNLLILLLMMCTVLLNILMDQNWGWLSTGLPGYDDVSYFGDGAVRMANFFDGQFEQVFNGITTQGMHVPYMSLLASIASLAGQHQRLLLSILQGLVLIFALTPLTRFNSEGAPRSLAGSLAVIVFCFAWPLTHHAIVEGRPDCVAGLMGGVWAVIYLSPGWTSSRALQVWSALLFLPMLLIKEPFFPLMLGIAGLAFLLRISTDVVLAPQNLSEQTSVIDRLKATLTQNVRTYWIPLILLALYLLVRAKPIIAYIYDVMIRPEGVARYGSSDLQPLYYLTGAGADFATGALFWVGLLILAAASIICVQARDWRSLSSFASIFFLALLAFVTVTVNPVKSFFFAAPLAGLEIVLVGAALNYLITSPIFASLSRDDDEPAHPRTIVLAAILGLPIVVLGAMAWSMAPDRTLGVKDEARMEGPILRAALPAIVGSGHTVVVVGATQIINGEQLQSLAASAIASGWSITECANQPVEACAQIIDAADSVVFFGPDISSRMPGVLDVSKYADQLKARYMAKKSWRPVALPGPELVLLKRTL